MLKVHNILLLTLLLPLMLPPAHSLPAAPLSQAVHGYPHGGAEARYRLTKDARDKVGNISNIFLRDFLFVVFQRYDRWGYGFGSDGYLYDFVKRSDNNKRARTYNPWGFGSDGYLYDFVKKSGGNKRARAYNPWGFGSDGYLYDFVRK